MSFPPSFQSDATFHDRTPIGRGNHQLYRTVQPTEWSRKAGLAGREVCDIRAHELAHRGIQEFALRLLSEGRFQGLVWTRSISETVFLTHLLKQLREASVDIDSVARTFFSDTSPDKHKEAAKFMEPLVTDLVSHMKRRVPPATSQDSDELAHARRKLAQAGITLTPRKRDFQQVDPGTEADETDEAAKILKGPPVRQISRPEGVRDANIAEWLHGFKEVFPRRGQYAKFCQHVEHVQALLKKSAKADLVQAAVAFGLDSKMAPRPSIKNLSTLIAAAQFQAS